MAPSVRIVQAGVPSVVGTFAAKSPTAEIPKGFAAVCESMRWPTAESWRSLADQQKTWFLHENGAYIYRNTRDGQWWIDEPSGGGVYVAKSDSDLPPTEGAVHASKCKKMFEISHLFSQRLESRERERDL